MGSGRDVSVVQRRPAVCRLMLSKPSSRSRHELVWRAEGHRALVQPVHHGPVEVYLIVPLWAALAPHMSQPSSLASPVSRQTSAPLLVET